ncbi:lipase, partial [Viridothelium virens]
DYNELVRAATLSSAAYDGCQIQAFDVNITQQLYDVASDTQGYIGFSPSEQRISVVLRGSTTPQDFANDMDTAPVTPVLSGVNFPPGTQVMNGVYTPWLSVHNQTIAEVRRLIGLYPNYTLESTGHSLGGALTYLSYISLAQNFPGKNITSNALAAFAIGNDIFANFGSSQQGELRRGNNVDDGVPNTYPQFTHYGIEFYGNGTLASTVQCEGETDSQCSAGNGLTYITPGHFFSFGIELGTTGCGGGIPSVPTK